MLHKDQLAASKRFLHRFCKDFGGSETQVLLKSRLGAWKSWKGPLVLKLRSLAVRSLEVQSYR